MIDAHDIIKREAVRHAADPPGVARLRVRLPAVDGIPPELSGGGEAVGRAAGHHRGKALLIQLEQLRMTPGVRRVESDIDRDVPDDLNAPLVRVVLQRVPLRKEQILLKLVEPDLLREPCAAALHRRRLPQPYILRPFHKGHASQLVLDRAVERIVREPGRVLLHEHRKRRTVRVVARAVPGRPRRERIGAVIIGRPQRQWRWSRWRPWPRPWSPPRRARAPLRRQRWPQTLNHCPE